MKKYSEEELQTLTQALLTACLENPGTYVSLHGAHGEVNQRKIFDRVRNMLKLMGISYSIPQPEVVPESPKEVTKYIYKIKVMTDAQLEAWRKDQKKNGTFSVRNSMREPKWFNDRMEF